MNEPAQDRIYDRMNDEPSDEEISARRLNVALARYILGTVPDSKQEFIAQLNTSHQSKYTRLCSTACDVLLGLRYEQYFNDEIDACAFMEDISIFTGLGYKVVPARYIKIIFDAECDKKCKQRVEELDRCLDSIIFKTVDSGLPELAEALNTRKSTLLQYARGHDPDPQGS